LSHDALVGMKCDEIEDAALANVECEPFCARQTAPFGRADRYGSDVDRNRRK
jgi:hypothetical protein